MSYAPRLFEVIHGSVLCVRFASNNSNKSNLLCYKHTQKCSLMSKCLRWWWTRTQSASVRVRVRASSSIALLPLHSNSNTKVWAVCRFGSFMLHTIFPFQSVVSVIHIVAAKLKCIAVLFCCASRIIRLAICRAVVRYTAPRVSRTLYCAVCVHVFFVQSVYFVLVVCWVWRSPEKPIQHSVWFQWYARYDSFRA